MSKRTAYTLLSAFVLLLVLFAITGTAWATTFSTPVDADYGHITNSVYLSQDDFPDGAPAAVLAGSESYTDALTATVLAKAAGGPLLLTSSTSLSTSARTELVRLKVTKVYVIGLSTTIIDAVKAALPSLTADKFVVLAGSDVYQTAALVAGKVKELAGATPTRVFIVPGDVYGSSLAAAAVAAANGWPILLTPQAGPFPSASTQAIADLGVTKGVRVDTSADPAVPGFSVEKTIMGTTSPSDDPGARYSESSAMAEYAVQQGWATYAHLALGEEQGGSVAYSENFPDNVLLASHIAGVGGAYLLSRSAALQSTVVDILKQHGKDIGSIDFTRPDYDQVSSGKWSFAAIRYVKSLNSPRVTGLSSTSGPLAGGGALTVTGSGFTGATTVRIGKSNLPAGSWRANSDTSITIDSLPAATQPGAMEILVYNYWHVSPSNPNDVYLYLSPGGPQLAAMSVVQEAVKYLGVPYVWAGASTSGFDCSGFTLYLYNKFKAQTGVTLPHKSTYQASYGTPVAKEDLLPGDLVFFGSPISHVGMYVGNGLMINAPRSGDLVTIEDVFRTNYVTARRLISPYTRVEDTSTLLAYKSTWTKGSATSASGGSYKYCDSSGASVTVSFNGTYLQWIAKKSSGYGLAAVFVDGKAAGTVNLYSSIVQYKQKVWDTGQLANGTHTVTITRLGTSGGGGTIIGLDAFDILGTAVQATSGPTTTRYQDTDTRIAYAGLWQSSTSTSASGGSMRYIGKTGSASITFNGTSLAWIAKKSDQYGIAKVTVDGASAGTVDLYSAAAGWAQSVWNTGTLPNGKHTVTIEWTGDKNSAAAASNISLDAFDIMGTPVALDGLARHDQTDSHLVYAGIWATYTTSSASGGSYKRANTSGASVTLTFTGTYLSWIATAGTTTGKAYVSLDGGTAQSVDLARTAVQYQQSVWATGIVAPGAHTVKIWWDTGNAAGKYITVDAFDVIGTLGGGGGTPVSTATRWEQPDSHFVYVGTWTPSSDTSASGGSFRYSNTPGSSVTVTFNGTYLGWIAKLSPAYGIAKVTLDSNAPVTVDLYNAATVWKALAWETGTLSPGAHTVKIEWTGTANAAATDSNVSVDAFEVIGTLQ